MVKSLQIPRISAFLLLSLGMMCPLSQGFQHTDSQDADTLKKPDYSKESFVIEQLADDVVFSSDGTGQEDRMGRVRIQSDSAVQQFGVLTFLYRGAFEQLEIVDVHVKKPDGVVIATP